MAHHMSQEPFLIAGLVALACGKMGGAGLRHMIVTKELSDQQLRTIVTRFEAAETAMPDYASAMASERVFAAQTVAELTRDPDLLGWTASPRTVDICRMVHRILGQRGFSIVFPDRTIGAHLRTFYDLAEETAHVPAWELLGPAEPAKIWLKELPKWDVVSRVLFPALKRARGAYELCRAEVRMLRIAAALEAFRRAKGKYPAALNELKGGLLRELPVDPFNGRDFRYRVQNNVWTLYSIGEDLKDDGGKRTARRQLDLVFTNKR